MEIYLLSTLYILFTLRCENNCWANTTEKICSLMDSRKTPGKCVPISQCEEAIGNLQSGIFPVACSETNGGSKNGEVCCPTVPRISAEKCELYKNILRDIKPDSNSNELHQPLPPIRCSLFLSTRISGGRDASKKEYPHQVALGYEPSSDNVTWRCGGVLLSDRFVLTAGHCVLSDITTQHGGPKKVLLGDIRLSKQDDEARVIVDVLEAIPHPDYKPPVVYNDLAILKLKTTVTLSRSILPACLPQPHDRLDKKMAVETTGWGQLGAVESQSDILQSVNLSRFKLQECSSYFEDSSMKSKLPYGIIRSQFCAGDKYGIKDTCRGDSGGPAVVTKEDACVYYVVGLTSFGSNFCGYQQPGVYTNVQRYLDWIEEIVWPQSKEKNSKPTTKRHSLGGGLFFPTPKMLATTTSTLPPTVTTTRKPSVLVLVDSPTSTKPTTLANKITTTMPTTSHTASITYVHTTSTSTSHPDLKPVTEKHKLVVSTDKPQTSATTSSSTNAIVPTLLPPGILPTYLNQINGNIQTKIDVSTNIPNLSQIDASVDKKSGDINRFLSAINQLYRFKK